MGLGVPVERMGQNAKMSLAEMTQSQLEAMCAERAKSDCMKRNCPKIVVANRSALSLTVKTFEVQMQGSC